MAGFVAQPGGDFSSPGTVNQGGGLQLPGGVNLQLPSINIGGGGSSGGNNLVPPTSPGATNNNGLLSMLPLLALLGLAGYFPNKSTTDTSGSSTSDTTSNFENFLKFLTDTTQTSTGTTTQGTQPTLSPATQAMLDRMIGRYNSLTSPSLTGYEAQQTANINASADAQRQAVNNIMAARGVATSPVAATIEANTEQNRLNQITSMQAGLPLLKNQMDLQNLAGASAFFSAIPKGSLTTGTTSQNVTGQTSGSQTGTGTSTGSTKGTNQGKSTTESGGGLPGLFGGLGSGFALLLPYLLQNMGIKLPQTTVGTPNQIPQGVPGSTQTRQGLLPAGEPVGTGEQNSTGINLSPTRGGASVR